MAGGVWRGGRGETDRSGDDGRQDRTETVVVMLVLIVDGNVMVVAVGGILVLLL